MRIQSIAGSLAIILSKIILFLIEYSNSKRSDILLFVALNFYNNRIATFNLFEKDGKDELEDRVYFRVAGHTK